jgi:hypothetical protein
LLGTGAMRHLQRVFPLLTGFLVACGGMVADAPSESTPPHDATGEGSGSGAASAGAGEHGGTVTGPEAVVGELYALTVVTNGQTSQSFDLNFQVMPPPADACDRATSTVGSCCYFAPVRRPPTQPPGSGTPSIESSAGTVTLTDVTSNARIDSFDYRSGAYSHAPANYRSPVWQPGDELRVNAAGDQIGAFTVSASTLLPPAVQVPSPIVRGQDVVITWRPDAHAEAFSFSILDTATGGDVVCSVPDAAGTLTIDASLFAAFEPSAQVQGVAERRAVRYAQTPTGRVAFKTLGWTSVEVSID